MALDFGPSLEDIGATQPITGESRPLPYVATDKATLTSQEKAAEQLKKLGVREVGLDLPTMTRITSMLVRREFGSGSRYPWLREKDLPRLEQLADTWDAIYEPGQGAAYNTSQDVFHPHVITETSQEKLQRVAGRLQQQLQNSGARLSYIRPREGTLATGFNEPYIRIAYRNPFQALRMKWLLRPSHERPLARAKAPVAPQAL